MTTTETYRVGSLTANGSSLPTPSEVYEGISGEFSVRKEEYDEDRDETLVYKHKGRDAHLEETEGDYSYCHFTYVSDTLDSIRVRTDDDEETDDSRQKLETSRILYFENGQFIYESRQDMLDLWIPKFLGEITDTEMEAGDWRFEDSLPQDVMEDFFQSRPTISVLKVAQPEDGGSISGDSTLANAVADLAGRVSSQRFSIGNQTGNNLKGASIIDESAEKLDILEISGKYENGHTTNLKSTGPIKISWNEDDWADTATTAERSRHIRNKLRPFLEDLDG
ncbi:hypothetical protein [Haloarcula laminariae]|uniref:hypothetical protein n=1 Tax=Haloarcula laminariae TaxID=2961577 RepID=UPI002406381E|nr:hypothetical protein [Halomicroarcula sp. FL173]